MHIACCLRQSAYPPEFKSLINQNHQLICPAHKCHHCQTRTSSTSLCLECSVGYHRKCLPNSIEKVNNRYFLCANHQSKEILINLPVMDTPEEPEPAKEILPQSNKISLILNGDSSKFNIKIGTQMQSTNGKSKSKKVKPEMSAKELQELYSSFGLDYLAHVDYENYEGNWCRFCGARYSPKFHDSILGQSTFCDKHHRIKERGKINISKLRGLKNPLKPNENKEVSYMKKRKRELAKLKI